MDTIEKGSWNQKGTWWQANRDGERVVLFSCPSCGGRGTLTGSEANHSVSEAGEVSPSVVCDCGFHEHIKLNDYAE